MAKKSCIAFLGVGLWLCITPIISANIIWDNGAGDNQWGTAQNWSTNNLPASSDTVELGLMGAGETQITTGGSAVCNIMLIGQTATAPGELFITGGQLATSGQVTVGNYSNQSAGISTLDMQGGEVNIPGAFFIMAQHGGSYGIVEMSNDARIYGFSQCKIGNHNDNVNPATAYGWMTLNDAAAFCGGSSQVGNNDYGNGVLTLNGGEFSIVNTLTVAYYANAVGHIQLNDGTIWANDFTMSLNGGAASMDINDGMLVVHNTASYSKISGYVSGGKITAKGGAGTVVVAQDAQGVYVYAQKTGLTKAQNPSPISGTTGSATSLTLSWKAGNTATSYDVYFGTDYAAVRDASISNPRGVYAGNTTATNFTPSGLLEQQVYYWRADARNGTTTAKGLVWIFETGEGKATNPSPADGSLLSGLNITLSWTAGVSANTHRVYFGTSFNAVQNAVPGSDAYLGEVSSTSYSITGLQLDTTYYWRIDEISAGSDFTGDVWSFTTPGKNDFTIENFDTYATTTTLKAVWQDGTSSAITLETDANFLAYQGNSLQWNYSDTNPANGYVSEISRTYSSDQDWTAGGVETLSFWYYAPQDINQLSVELSDGTHTVAQTITDAATLSAGTWREILLRLDGFSPVQLTKVRSIKFRQKNNISGGSGYIYLDNIRAYPPRCTVSALPPGDYSGDCIVDWTDFAQFLNGWLMSDYRVVARQPTPTVRCYLKFDETSGLIAHDDTGNFNGTLDAAGAGKWQTSAGFQIGCLHFDGTFGVTLPTGAFAGLTSGFTVSLWVKADPADRPERISTVEFGAGDNTGGSDEVWQTSGKDLTQSQFAGQWTHFAFVKDVAAGTLRTYINGVLIDQTAAANQFGTAGSTRIGGSDTNDFFKGSIDELRIYAAPLSDAEILYLAKGAGAAITQPITGVLIHKDIINNGKVDFSDFSALAKNWLNEGLWP